MLHCDTCGAPVDRSEAGTLRHTADYPQEDNQTLHIVMIGYLCTNAERAPGDSHMWGKMRVIGQIREPAGGRGQA